MALLLPNVLRGNMCNGHFCFEYKYPYKSLGTTRFAQGKNNVYRKLTVRIIPGKISNKDLFLNFMLVLGLNFLNCTFHN